MNVKVFLGVRTAPVTVTCIRNGKTNTWKRSTPKRSTPSSNAAMPKQKKKPEKDSETRAEEEEAGGLGVFYLIVARVEEESCC